MKIRENFYTELRNEMRECAAECADALSPHPAESSAALFDHLFRSDSLRRLKNAAGGLNEDAFERLANQALETAERLGLNILAETRGTVGMISLRTAMICLSASADHLHISRLLTLLSTADRLHFCVVPEDGEMLLQLSMYYDLKP